MIQRVAIISPYALNVFGGVQEQALAMSRELSRRGVEVLLVAPDSDDRTIYDTPARVEHFGRRVSIRANGSRAPLALGPSATFHARDAVREFNPDVVHFHEPFAPMLGWAALKAHEFASVATFHRSGDGPAIRLTKPLLRRLARGIDVALSVSQAARDTLTAATGLASEVLFNGFETDRFVHSPRQRGHEVILFTVGRFEARKGVAVAIEAVRRHNDQAKDPWQLVVAGDGPERARLHALAAHDERIVFLGAVDDEQKRAWLRRASVVVAPATHGESFGMVLLEAMASEVVVVASDIEGYRQAADGHATLVTPGDPDALAAGVERALASEGPESLDAARRHAESWSMTRLMDLYLERYQSAIELFSPSR